MNPPTSPPAIEAQHPKLKPLKISELESTSQFSVYLRSSLAPSSHSAFKRLQILQETPHPPGPPTYPKEWSSAQSRGYTAYDVEAEGLPPGLPIAQSGSYLQPLGSNVDITNTLGAPGYRGSRKPRIQLGSQALTRPSRLQPKSLPHSRFGARSLEACERSGPNPGYPLPGSQEYGTQLPFWLFLQCLGHDFM